MSKTLYFSTCGVSIAHLSIEREIIEETWGMSQKRYLLMCTGKLNSCYLNPVHNMLGCAACISRTKKYLCKEFDFDGIYYVENKEVNLRDIPAFQSMEELKAYSYDGIEIGRGVASSLISIKRDSRIDLGEYSEFISHSLHQSATLIQQIKRIVKELNLSTIVLFNGRFAETYPVMSLCKKLGIEYYTHDKAANFKRYQLIKNNTVHNIDHRLKDIEEVWAKSSGGHRELATQWYEEKRNGIITSEIVFTGDQEEKRLPDNFDTDRHNIAIFNSSEDEVKAIQEWDHDLYENQISIILRICKAMESEESIHFYLRFHPNLKGMSKADEEILAKAELKNLTMIPPESKVSTYYLMDCCDKVLGFGSRTCAEAAYWNKPSIVYGKSFYNHLESLYSPSDFKALIDLLKQKDVKPKQGEDLLKTAYYLLKRGHAVRYAKIENKNKAFYKGQLMSLPKLGFLVSFINLKGITRWVSNYRILNLGKPTFRSFLKLK